MKYSLSQIAKITNAATIGKDIYIDRIITDSRSIGRCETALFVAIEGENHDGHKYIKDMYLRGVRAFMVEHKSQEELPEAEFIVVEDAIEALQLLATEYRSHFKGHVVAVTGSNGKTIIKEWIAQLSPQNIKIFRSPKSYNSQLGVPLSILMMRGDEDVAVIEAGISQVGEMARLERIIRPEIVIVTNIGDAHQANFTSQQQKLEQKLLLCKGAKTIIYDREQSIISEAINEKFSDRKLVAVDSKTYSLKLPFSDHISKINASKAVALYELLGVDIGPVIEATKGLQAVAMRMELKDGVEGSTIINDSYNSDINSLSLSLDYLCSIALDRRKILILSDILQSGVDPQSLYAEVNRLIVQGGVDLLVGVGGDISSCSELFSCDKIFYRDTKELIEKFDRKGLKNSVILVKGGRSFCFEDISHALERKVHTTTLEVNLDAMIHNISYFRSKLEPQTKLIAMVKALSYGHGDIEIAKMLQKQGVAMLAVAFADEGVTLREQGITMPIVVLNADSDSFETMIDYDLEPEIYSICSLSSFDEHVQRNGLVDYPIHLKLDTGMHRLGFVEQDLEGLIAYVKGNKNIRVASIFSHLAVSDDNTEDEFTMAQISLFNCLSSRIIESLPYGGVLRHISNSAAIERFPEAQFDAVRLGIGLYGISVEEQDKLQNVSELKSRIVQIKTLTEGQTVGYGRHGKITGNQKIATVPMGYADGLDRRLSRGGWSLRVGDHMAPIIGNICMDTCMIDITGIEAKEGDQVTIFGTSPTIIEMAARLETIPYEIMTSISTRVKRIYIKE